MRRGREQVKRQVFNWRQQGLKWLKVARLELFFTKGKLGYGGVWTGNSPTLSSLSCLGISEMCKKTYPLLDRNDHFDM